MQNPQIMARLQKIIIRVQQMMQDPQAMARAQQILQHQQGTTWMQEMQGNVGSTVSQVQPTPNFQVSFQSNLTENFQGMSQMMNDPAMMQQMAQAAQQMSQMWQDPQMLANAQKMMQDPQMMA